MVVGGWVGVELCATVCIKFVFSYLLICRLFSDLHLCDPLFI